MMAGGDLYNRGKAKLEAGLGQSLGDTSMTIRQVDSPPPAVEPEQNVVDRFAGTGPIGTAVKGVLQSLGFN